MSIMPSSTLPLLQRIPDQEFGVFTSRHELSVADPAHSPDSRLVSPKHHGAVSWRCEGPYPDGVVVGAACKGGFRRREGDAKDGPLMHSTGRKAAPPLRQSACIRAIGESKNPLTLWPVSVQSKAELR